MLHFVSVNLLYIPFLAFFTKEMWIKAYHLECAAPKSWSKYTTKKNKIIVVTLQPDLETVERYSRLILRVNP